MGYQFFLPWCFAGALRALKLRYQAYVWRKALVPRQDLPTPAGNGWTIQGNSMFPQLTTRPSSPESILEFVNCQCSKSSCRQKCSCSNNGLACTEACKCMADENCHKPTRPVITIQMTTMICQSIIRLLDTIKAEHIFPVILSNVFIDTFFWVG